MKDDDHTASLGSFYYSVMFERRPQQATVTQKMEQYFSTVTDEDENVEVKKNTAGNKTWQTTDNISAIKHRMDTKPANKTGRTNNNSAINKT